MCVHKRLVWLRDLCRDPSRKLVLKPQTNKNGRDVSRVDNPLEFRAGLQNTNTREKERERERERLFLYIIYIIAETNHMGLQWDTTQLRRNMKVGEAWVKG